MQWSGTIHRATAHYNHENPADTGEETVTPAYTFQAPDVDRTIVGTFIQCAGKPGQLGDNWQQGELSFDADAKMFPQPPSGEVESDDTRSSVLHYASARGNGDNGTYIETQPYMPQSTVWRRGTELFYHSALNASSDSSARVIVFYKEND